MQNRDRDAAGFLANHTDHTARSITTAFDSTEQTCTLDTETGASADTLHVSNHTGAKLCAEHSDPVDAKGASKVLGDFVRW